MRKLIKEQSTRTRYLAYISQRPRLEQNFSEAHVSIWMTAFRARMRVLVQAVYKKGIEQDLGGYLQLGPLHVRGFTVVHQTKEL